MVVSARLLGVSVAEFRSIRDQRLPLDGLVVLFGPNSAGKTSILEAAVELLRAASAARMDQGVVTDELASGWICFDLPDAAVADTLDARLFEGWGGVAPEIAAFLGGEAAAATRERIGSAADGRKPDAAADREILARGVAGILLGLDPAGITWGWTQSDEVFVQVDPALIPGEVGQAADRVMAEADPADPLWETALFLREAKIAVGQDQGALGDAIPPVIVLDVGLGSLSAQLHDSVQVIHDRLWGDPQASPVALRPLSSASAPVCQMTASSTTRGWNGCPMPVNQCCPAFCMSTAVVLTGTGSGAVSSRSRR